MSIDGVSVSQSDAMQILNFVKGDINRSGIKKLSPTERRVVAAMLTALKSGEEVTAPSKDVLTNIRNKLSGRETGKTTAAQKAHHMVEKAWSGVFGHKAISSKGLSDLAKETSNLMSKKEDLTKAAAFTEKLEFRKVCIQMNKFFRDLKNDYRNDPNVALDNAKTFLKAREAEIIFRRDPEHTAFVKEIQLPAIQSQIAALESEAPSEKFLNQLQGEATLWSNITDVKKAVEDRSVSTQTPTAKMSAADVKRQNLITAAKFTGSPQFREACKEMKKFYKDLDNDYKFDRDPDSKTGYTAVFRAKELLKAKELQVKSAPADSPQRAFLNEVQIPAIKAAIKEIESREDNSVVRGLKGLVGKGGPSKTLLKKWGEEAELWSKPGKAKDVIDARAGLAQLTEDELVEWMVMNPKDPKFQKWQKLMSKTYNDAIKADGTERVGVLREAWNKMEKKLEKRSPDGGAIHRADIAVLTIMRDELLRAMQKIGEGQYGLYDLEMMSRNWDSLDSAQRFMKGQD